MRTTTLPMHLAPLTLHSRRAPKHRALAAHRIRDVHPPAALQDHPVHYPHAHGASVCPGGLADRGGCAGEQPTRHDAPARHVQGAGQPRRGGRATALPGRAVGKGRARCWTETCGLASGMCTEVETSLGRYPTFLRQNSSCLAAAAVQMNKGGVPRSREWECQNKNRDYRVQARAKLVCPWL